MRGDAPGCRCDLAGLVHVAAGSSPASRRWQGLTAVPRVAVLVDLPLVPAAGGHVKCWERFAEAAVAAPGELDLTVFFLGERPETRELAPHVRYRLLPARLGTRDLRLESGAGHTDLAGWHPRLARELAG
ncbi:MAG TPA: hypothetical protein DCY89_03935, partial [Gammaproteobacteria bacterium]|nr:hypothetical protein [Gammaproteobacteria bacterium]